MSEPTPSSAGRRHGLAPDAAADLVLQPPVVGGRAADELGGDLVRVVGVRPAPHDARLEGDLLVGLVQLQDDPQLRAGSTNVASRSSTPPAEKFSVWPSPG